jgi:Holliday junction resolvase
MTRYEFGAEKERKIVKELRESGWFATRTPKSGTPIDVIAIRVNPFNKLPEVLLIQVKASKSGNAILPKDDREKLQELAEKFRDCKTIHVEAWLLHKRGRRYVKQVIKFI